MRISDEWYSTGSVDHHWIIAVKISTSLSQRLVQGWAMASWPVGGRLETEKDTNKNTDDGMHLVLQKSDTQRVSDGSDEVGDCLKIFERNAANVAQCSLGSNPSPAERWLY